MAQARVTDFFSTRKRTTESQPSKRRKLNIFESGVETLTSVKLNTRPTRSSTRSKKLVVDPRRENQAASVTDKVSDFLSAANVKGTVNLQEEVTSAWDEHDGLPQTPSKRAKEIDSDSDSTEFTRKRTRRGKSKNTVDNLTPEKKEAPKEKPRSVRKRLNLKKCVIDSSDSNDSDNEKNAELQKDKPITLKMPPAISPLPETPENVRQQLKETQSVPMSSKVKNAMDLVKKLQQSKGKKKTGSTPQESETQTSVDSMKEKLSKIGGIEDLKARLADVSKTKASLKKPVPQLKKFDSVDIKVDTSDSAPKEAREKTAPAFERFHSLATPAPPTLSLPYHFKILAEIFRSMDTVVSMLHNRNECCTFSKLKAAVQGMTKRNFDEKKTGQIKTVYPTAYKFNQVKGLPAFGNKAAGYQLCVEAILEDEASTQKPSVKSMLFSAQQLLNRRSTFHNKLIAIVKKYHKEFLASMERPLSIPDDKITRWHPKFRLDEVPDVEPAELPKPPEVKSYQTAKDVLEQARGKLLPKVEKALETVALKSEVKQETKPTPAPQAKTNTDDAKYKGIPQGLLEKIRAKENKKLEMAMMRNPAEDKRKEMLRRLPEMMRILRTHFVTEKKPALTMENVVQKLADSHRSYMAPASVESHVKLMLEVLPEWLKMIQIQKGKYLKMDRNLDLQTITDKVLNMSKS